MDCIGVVLRLRSASRLGKIVEDEYEDSALPAEGNIWSVVAPLPDVEKL